MIRRTIEAALRFLLSAQDADGAWRDFDLPPGAAEAWTTAYAGRCVQEAASEASGAAVARARGFLERQARVGGWSYNRVCPPDADSTAQALIFLSEPSPKHIAGLARFFQPDGGVRTYIWPPPGHGWGDAHPEVTATALRALLRWLPSDHELIRRGIAWLSPEREAYWWDAPHYLPLELLRLRALVPDSPVKAPPDAPGTTVFDIALALECAVLTGSSGEELSRALLGTQLGDGSWPAGSILRLPEPAGSGAAVYADTRRIFTTATALSALVQAERVASTWSGKPFSRVAAEFIVINKQKFHH
jgi:hypothetical protein